MFVSADFSTVYDAAFISVKYCAYQCRRTKSVIVITIHMYTCLAALFWDYPGGRYQKGKTNLDITEAKRK